MDRPLLVGQAAFARQRSGGASAFDGHGGDEGHLMNDVLMREAGMLGGRPIEGECPEGNARRGENRRRPAGPQAVGQRQSRPVSRGPASIGRPGSAPETGRLFLFWAGARTLADQEGEAGELQSHRRVSSNGCTTDA